MQNVITDLRKNREEKRSTRKAMRKIRLKDLRKDGKGYLSVSIDEPELQTPPAEVEKKEKDGDLIINAVKKTNKNIIIWFAGAAIVVGAVVAISKASK
jgi:hypothetical protein